MLLLQKMVWSKHFALMKTLLQITKVRLLKILCLQPTGKWSFCSFIKGNNRLDVLEDEIKFANSPNEGVWISKPYTSNQGKNVKIIADITKFKKDFLHTKKATLGESLWNDIFNSEAVKELMKEEEKEDSFEKIDTRVVIQKYIEKPLLINNRKFDIR